MSTQINKQQIEQSFNDLMTRINKLLTNNPNYRNCDIKFIVDAVSMLNTKFDCYMVEIDQRLQQLEQK